MESTRPGLQWPGAEPSGGRSVTKAVLVAQLGAESDSGGPRETFPTIFDALRETVAAHEGTIVRQAARSLCASFPSAHGALETAMLIRHLHPGEPGPGATGWRIGVDASRPATTLRGDPTLAPLIRAKHLAELALDGEVLASERVWELLGPQGSLAFHRSRRTEVTRMPDRLAAWAVSWEAPGHPSSRLPLALWPHLEGPFVGRVSEGAWLRAAWRRAKAGRAELVSVAGPSGIGKTCLCAQLGKLAVEQGGVVLYGACDETAGAPYQVFVEALLQLAEQEFVVSLGASQRTELARLSPRLAEDATAAADLSPDPDSGRIRLFGAVRSFLAGAAERRPVLLLLDDLQWIDRAEALLLDHLVRTLGSAPVLVVAAHRSGLGDDHLYRPVSPAAGLRLSGFDVADVARYLSAVLPGRAWKQSGSAEALWQETFGNPLFLSMAARELAESGGGAPPPAAAGARVGEPEAGGPKSPLCPGGAAALVDRRLDRLGGGARRVLEQAAALGRQFDAPLLAMAVGAPVETVTRWLEEASREGLLRSVRGAYSFAHALVRQVLLDGLGDVPRAELHLRAAEALEAAGGTGATDISAIATCYRTAGIAAPPGKAIEWSVRAGEAAVSSLAWEEARGHWEAALELMEKSGCGATERALLLRHLADLAVLTGSGLAGGIQHAEGALALYQQLGEKERAVAMHTRLGRDLSVFPETMDVPRALRHLDAAEALLARDLESPLLGYVHSGQAGAYLWANQPAAGLAAAQRAFEIARREGRPGLEAYATLGLGWHHAVQGRFAAGLRHLQDACELADHLDHRYLGCLCTWALGNVQLMLLDPRAAGRPLERELARPRMAEVPSQIRVLSGQLAWARCLLGDLGGARAAVALAPEGDVGFVYGPPLGLFEGDWEGGAESLGAALSRARAAGNRMEEWGVGRWLALALLLLGDFPGARRIYTEAAEQVSLAGHVPAEVSTRSGLALACAEEGDLEEAAGQLRRIEPLIAGGEDWRGLGGLHAHAAGAVAGLDGRLEDAASHFGRAVDSARRLGLAWHEADALLSWSRVLARAGESGRARERLRRARGVLEGIGASPRWVERLYDRPPT